MALGTAYRPNSFGVTEILDALSDFVNSIAQCDYTCKPGDFNVDMADKHCNRAKDIMQFCYQHNLEQLVKEPTRVTDRADTILDLVLTNTPSRCKNIKVIHNRCLGDHALVLLDMDIRKPKFYKQIKQQRLLRNINSDAFARDLKLIPWDSIYNLENVDEMVQTFNAYMSQLFDAHAPVRTLTLRDKPKPWITDMLLFMLSLREDALEKAQKDKKDCLNEYNRSQTHVSFEIKLYHCSTLCL
ncbi:unnamed protein product [Parnassius mnemosyne]|uniref:Endonuclease/exonuclease/phosphatase domain-containing protein n=1 Tax=Parnassius mnemosyne TaxID=213953 RepID=A0AAV1LK97_9NEOP